MQNEENQQQPQEEHQQTEQIQEQPIKEQTDKQKVTSLKFKFTVLFMNCMLTFGSYYSFDLPSAYQNALMEWMNIDKSEYQLYYTIYTISGPMIDKLGTRKSAITFTSLVVFGMLLYSIGIQTKQHWLAVVGRAFFAFNGAICSVQNAITVFYFKDTKFLSTAMSCTLCVSRLGSVLNFFVTPALADSIMGVTGTTWFAFCLCILSIIFVMLFAYLDKKNEKLTNQKADAAGKTIRFRELLTFRPEYWLICVVIAIYYGTIFPFVAVAQLLFTDLWGFDDYLASVCTGIVYDFALVFSIPIGSIVDKYSTRMYFAALACIFSLAANLTLLLAQPTDTDSRNEVPWISMCLIGCGYVLAAATTWSSISLVVKKSQTGTAMALATAIQMVYNTIVQQVTGELSNNDDIYLFVAQSVLTYKKNFYVLNRKGVCIFKDTPEEEHEALLGPEEEQQQEQQAIEQQEQK